MSVSPWRPAGPYILPFLLLPPFFVLLAGADTRPLFSSTSAGLITHSYPPV